MPDLPHLAAIALAWAAYGGLHSWLAGQACKDWVSAHWPAAMPAYRLVYNLIALALLALPLQLTISLPGDPLWHWPAWLSWPAAALSVAGFLWTLRWYDGLDFIGLRQWRSGRAGPAMGEALRISPMHRLVRHPWYSLGLFLLWTRDLNAAWLVTAVLVTAYVLIGIRLEEAKLAVRYGEAYRRYRERVPALVPLPGRVLGRREAAELETLARTARPQTPPAG